MNSLHLAAQASAARLARFRRKRLQQVAAMLQQPDPCIDDVLFGMSSSMGLAFHIRSMVPILTPHQWQEFDAELRRQDAAFQQATEAVVFPSHFSHAVSLAAHS
ncbi:MAG TPA: hypothetical protein VF614_01705 [Chthoniobacteraceae bacterium]|jgi:hypothetical protein